MDQEHIIPTRFKSKLPHTQSYPIGAQAISGALRGVPQFAQLIVDFYLRKPSARRREPLMPYPVISVWYSGPMRYFSMSRTVEEQSRGPRWLIQVDAVPRSLRHVIQSKIAAEALPAMRSWLMANMHDSHREGGHGLAFSFDELKDELISEETTSIEWQTEIAGR